MIAVDTNVIVRLIVADDPDQLELALALTRRDKLYISLTVLIETDWVLRATYGYERSQICTAFAALRDAFGIRFEAARDVRWALERYARAGELADYIHLSSARAAGSFATFERRLSRRAGSKSPAPVHTLA